MLRHMHMRRLCCPTAAVVAAVVALAGCAGHRAPLDYKTGAWESYVAAPTSDEISVYFYGGTLDSKSPCYEPHRLTANETATTVTVRLETSGPQGPFSAGEGCTQSASLQSASVRLQTSLGARRILDAARPGVVPSAKPAG